MMDDDVIQINQGSVPTFDGSANSFQMWLTNFQAFAMLSGFFTNFIPFYN
jgi:hypothetical protein